MDIENTLADLGLTQLETKIYTFLLRNGPNPVATIAKKIGSHRRNVYDALERMVQKGFASYIKDQKTKVYEITDPQFVKQRLELQTTNWADTIPVIQEQMQLWTEKKETLFYRGQAAIRDIFFDQLNCASEIDVIATNEHVDNIVKYFFPKFELMRQEKGIKTRMLFDSSLQKNPAKENILSLKNAEVKVLTNSNSTKVSQHIYANKVAIIVWEIEPFAILITESQIANVYKQQFELLWKQSKKIV